MSNKNKIIENWVGIEKVEDLARKQTNDPEAGFNATTYWFDDDGRHLMIPCMYRPLKGKKDQKVFAQKHKEIMISVNFCPFTGKPLYEDSIEAANSLMKEPMKSESEAINQINHEQVK